MDLRDYLGGAIAPPSDGKLIALKALSLGYAASADPLRKRTTLAMAAAAFAKLKNSRRPDRRLQLAFYHLLRAEMLRHDGDPLPDRVAAQSISAAIRSDLFDQFMLLESLTEHLAEPAQHYGTGDKHYLTTVAMNRLGISRSGLTNAQRAFLESTTLAEIMQHHGICFNAA